VDAGSKAVATIAASTVPPSRRLRIEFCLDHIRLGMIYLLDRVVILSEAKDLHFLAFKEILQMRRSA